MVELAQPQTATETKEPKEGEKKTEQPIDVHEYPEPAKDKDMKPDPASELDPSKKDMDTLAAEKTTEEKAMDAAKKAEDAAR